MAQPTVSAMSEEASLPTANSLQRRNFVICAVVAVASSLLVGFLFAAVVLPRTHSESGMGSMKQYMFTRCNGATPCTYTGGGTDFEKACNELGGSTYDALGRDYCFYKGQLAIFTRCNGATPCSFPGGGTYFEKACNELGGSTYGALGHNYCFYKGQLAIFTRCNGATPCTFPGGGTDFAQACNELGGSTYDALGRNYCFYKGELGKISQNSKGSAMLLDV